jgi:hypothetical protein
MQGESKIDGNMQQSPDQIKPGALVEPKRSLIIGMDREVRTTTPDAETEWNR